MAGATMPPGTRVCMKGRGKKWEFGVVSGQHTEGFVVRWESDGVCEDWVCEENFICNGGKVADSQPRNSYSELIGFTNDLKDLLDYHGARLLPKGEGFTLGEEGSEQDFTWFKLRQAIELYFEQKQENPS